MVGKRHSIYLTRDVEKILIDYQSLAIKLYCRSVSTSEIISKAIKHMRNVPIQMIMQEVVEYGKN